ncbi:MAG: hypothetical protein Kow0020_09530 [Wenzhouxiangellaceae bacterium]
MRRILALLLLAALGHLSAESAPPSVWRFEVLLDGKPIGEHRFELRGTPHSGLLVSEADYRVRFLGITVYRYHHRAEERWSDGCLESIEAATDDNGDQVRLKGRRLEDAFVVEGSGGQRVLPHCVQSFAYWNPGIRSASHLLNPQDGAFLPVTWASGNRESVELAELPADSTHRRLTTPEFAIDLWYDPAGRWLGLETETDGGKTLSYRVLELPGTLPWSPE